jgi:hypothetical protein
MWLLLQSATAPTPTLGTVIAWCTGAIGIAVSIYRLGVNSADTRNLKTSVTHSLDAMNAKLDLVMSHIAATQQQRVEDAEWKGEMATRLSAAERELSTLHRRREA